MRPLAVTNFLDYGKEIERQSIEEHRNYIRGQMQQARLSPDAARRSECLANVLAANGLMLRGMDVGFISAKPNYKAIQDTSRDIQATAAFRSLMEDSGERLAKGGDVDALVRELQDRDRKLSGRDMGDRPAIDVIRAAQAKVRARTAQPRDYAMLAAANRLSARRGQEAAPDGRLVEVVRRELNMPLSGKELSAETDRVLSDPDFRYFMKHEKRERLYVSALRLNGSALEQYPRRAEQLRAAEARRTGTAPGQAMK